MQVCMCCAAECSYNDIVDLDYYLVYQQYTHTSAQLASGMCSSCVYLKLANIIRLISEIRLKVRIYYSEKTLCDIYFGRLIIFSISLQGIVPPFPSSTYRDLTPLLTKIINEHLNVSSCTGPSMSPAWVGWLRGYPQFARHVRPKFDSRLAALWPTSTCVLERSILFLTVDSFTPRYCAPYLTDIDYKHNTFENRSTSTGYVALI